MAKYIAKKIKEMEGHGSKILWELCPPLEGHGYVITSSIVDSWSGPETYVFPANPEGEITSWGELPGSFRGEINHEAALENAGYSVDQG